jgi:ribosomal protein S18 acetylase RimI-like enzyme
MEVKFDEYFISDDKELLNYETIYSFLSRSYWANKRPTEKVKKSMDSSVCIGVYHGSQQIGLARIVTDDVTVYWLCDVFIDENYRGKGIGKKLIESIVISDRFKVLFGILGTKDAHGLYEEYEFVRDHDRFMSRIPDFLRNK